MRNTYNENAHQKTFKLRKFGVLIFKSTHFAYFANGKGNALILTAIV